MNRDERKKIGREVEIINRRFESQYFNPVLKALKWKVNELKDILLSGGVQAGISYLTTDLGNERLSDVVTDLYRNVGLRHASRTFADLRKQQREAAKSYSGFQAKGFGLSEEWLQFIADYLKKFLVEKMTYRVANTTRDKLLQILTDAMNEGKGVDEIVRELDELPFTRNQAARIVRTEIKRAGETGAKAASHSFEFEQQKVWIAHRDSRTRGVDPEDHADHFHMDGQTVDDNQKFFDARSNVYLEFPGDPQAAPGDTINCRCTHGYEAKRDENGRLIRKKTRAFVERDFTNRREIITI